MYSSGLLCLFLRLFPCLAIVLSCSLSAEIQGDEQQDLMQLLPKEIKQHGIWDYLLLKDYLTVIHLSKGLLRGSRLPRRAELEVAKRDFDSKLTVTLMRMLVGDVVVEMEGDAERGARQTTQTQRLKELVNEVFAVLDDEQNKRAIWTCCKALVTDKRLDAELWRAYADIFMEEIRADVTPRDTSTKMLETILGEAARAGLVGIIEEIVSSSEEAQVKIDLAANANNMIMLAIFDGHVRATQFLLAKKEEMPELYDNVDPTAFGNIAFQLISRRGHVEMVKFLLKKKVKNPVTYRNIDPTVWNNFAIRAASECGHIEVVRFLLANKEAHHGLYGGIDPAADDNYAIRLASKNGHVEIVRLLLAKKEENEELYGSIDPAAMDNYAIREASEHGHAAVVEYLLKKKKENPMLYGTISL